VKVRLKDVLEAMRTYKKSKRHYGISNTIAEIKKIIKELNKVRKNFRYRIIPFIIQILRIIIRRVIAAFIPFMFFVKAYYRSVDAAYYAMPGIVLNAPLFLRQLTGFYGIFLKEITFFVNQLMLYVFQFMQVFGLGHELIRFNIIFSFLTDMIIDRFFWEGFYHFAQWHLNFCEELRPHALYKYETNKGSEIALGWVFLVGGFYLKCCIYALLGMYPHVTIVTASALIWTQDGAYKDFMD
jgi:hypothetical protein